MKWPDEIKPNRVTWRGITFDSQLECDWCATFEAWGIDYVYHPGRIALSGGVIWEPDFHLELEGKDVVWEVKGDHNDRMWKVAQAIEELPALTIVVGRTPWIPPGSDIENAGAVWEPEDFVIFDAVSAYLAVSEDRMGLRMFKAIGKDGIA